MFKYDLGYSASACLASYGLYFLIASMRRGNELTHHRIDYPFSKLVRSRQTPLGIPSHRVVKRRDGERVNRFTRAFPQHFR